MSHKTYFKTLLTICAPQRVGTNTQTCDKLIAKLHELCCYEYFFTL